jgi:hypothetical protein
MATVQTTSVHTTTAPVAAPVAAIKTKPSTDSSDVDDTPITSPTERERLALEWEDEQNHYYLDCRDLYEIMN